MSMKPPLDRRTFLKDAGALAVSAALLAPGASPIAFADASRGPRIAAALFDGRYSSCREFANALARQGAAAFDVGADVALLWYGPLGDHLARSGGAVAGLTTHSDFAVSQSFGRQLRLLSKYEGAHDSRGSCTITHRLRGLADADQVGAAPRLADSHWGEALASALVRARWDNAAARSKLAVAQSAPIGDHPGFLTSWLLSA
ncbi:MAG TPA: twin-arginine translocation signal domain-containing protein [Candidatus Acidoferrales bacterium]|jgi:hypothetical protein|nr:twin-arginine translocation signal domain-containing protein [Candidatus Acidoferrales bacterium]